MSIAVALHAGSYVLCAADCREYIYEDQTLAAVEKEWRRPKIVHTDMGFVFGTGVSRVVHGVTHALTQRPAQTIGDVLGCIAEERRLANTWADSELRTHALKATGWFFTLNVVEPDATPGVHAGVFHPCLSETELKYVLPGHALPIMRPSSYDLYADWLDRSIRVCGPDDDVQENLAQHVDVLRTLLHRYASEAEAKSSAECTLAVHFADGSRFLSGVVHPGDIVRWTECNPDDVTTAVA